MTFEMSRKPYQGVLNIINNNWPFYLGGLCAGFLSIEVMRFISSPWVLKLSAGVFAGVSFFWVLGSLLVSYYVYDLSSLYRWEWLASELKKRPRFCVNIHAGLDEVSGSLKHIFSSAKIKILDIYDPDKMNEPAIRRARRLVAEKDRAESAGIETLPIADRACDAVFLIFSAHEIRSALDRLKFFKELNRILKKGGQVVIVEHLRDLNNFLAYGPGFLHFYPKNEWFRLAREGGFGLGKVGGITPFVKFFILVKK